MMAKVSVIEAARASNAFRRENWARAIGPMVLIVIGATLSGLWQKPAPAAAALASLVEAAGWVMSCGALLRLAFAPDHPGEAAFRPGRSGFQWGRVEWRLIGVGLLGFAVFVAAALLFGVVYAVAGGAMPDATGIHRPPPAVAIAAGLVLFCALVYVGLRLSMAMPATVDRGEIRFFRTWPLTRGAVLPIFGANLLIAAVVLGFSLIAIFGGMALGAVVGAAASFAAAGPAKMDAIKDMTSAGAGLGGAVVHAFVGVPLSIGVNAAIYRVLREQETA
jgi:hypothetical protein